MSDWRLSEGWKLIPDSRTPDPPEGEPGPWRDRDGGVMHGVYERVFRGVESGRPAYVEGVAAWHGTRLWSWSGPEMPRFRDPRVSPWNPILAQGLRGEGVEETPYRTPTWCDEWIADALLRNLKPYGRFALPYKSAMDWFTEAGRAGLVYRATRDDSGDEQRVYVVAAIAQTYGEAFDLDALIADYQDALPPELAAPQIDALQSHRDRSIALLYVLADDADERFFAAPRAVRGLTLGYPPCSTAARILAEAEPAAGMPHLGRFHAPVSAPHLGGHGHANGNGNGRTNGQQMIRVPECRHPGRPHARVSDMTPTTLATVVRWIDRSWPVDMPRGMYPDNAVELERSGYLIAIAYRAYVSSDPLLRVPICDDPAAESEMHRYICCLLRGMSKDPREIHLDAVYARKMVWS